MLSFLSTISRMVILVKESPTTSINFSWILGSQNGSISEGSISTTSIDFYWISGILKNDGNEKHTLILKS